MKAYWSQALVVLSEFYLENWVLNPAMIWNSGWPGPLL
jgi:hypothetical protein